MCNVLILVFLLYVISWFACFLRIYHSFALSPKLINGLIGATVIWAACLGCAKLALCHGTSSQNDNLLLRENIEGCYMVGFY